MWMQMNRTRKSVFAGNVGLPVLAVGAFAVLWAVLLHPRRGDILSSGVVAWWTVLCVLSVCNVYLWHLATVAAARRRATVEPAISLLQRQQLLLSAVYVFGCGFRSILPRADVQRIGLYDSWLSSVMVGRSVATVAELCFMAQWALLLNTVARHAESRFGVLTSWLLLPLIVAAEMCSWTAVLTTSYLGNVAEESLWALSVSLLMVSSLKLWSCCRRPYRLFLAAALAVGIVYVTFMCTVDIPMYVSRWLADEASGRAYLSVAEGFRDTWSRRSITFAWEAWRAEIPWMTLYFSVAVWCSIALAHVPLIAPKPAFESPSGASLPNA
ncbi:MAG TPA: hypothetical protein VH643_01250 [Gemmataceae bacterium]|jgi:hypothetical protein